MLTRIVLQWLYPYMICDGGKVAVGVTAEYVG